MEIRLAAVTDASAIAAIYNREVSGSTVTTDLVPRSLDEQERWILEHSGAYPALVALDPDGSVAGFGSLSPYRSRPAYITTVEDSVYVRSDRQGEGVGKLILSELISVAVTGGFHAVMARIVSSGSGSSVGLHLSCGFGIVGVEREVGRKFNQWLDVTLMQRLL